MASELMASEVIAPEVIAPEVIAPLEDIASDVMADELGAEVADELLLAVVAEVPQAARVRAREAPATRVRARFINISAP
ncbi:MAG TPA: hypothetical protein VIJ00_02975 [Nakamurella sp.]